MSAAVVTGRHSAKSRMHFVYTADWVCRGVLLSRPWNKFSPGMRRNCSMAIKRIFKRNRGLCR